MTQPFDPQQQYMAPVPPKKSHTFRNVVLVALAVIVIAAIASSAGKKKDSTPAAGASSPAVTSSGSTAGVVTSKPDGSDPKADVAITGCAPIDAGYLGAKVKLTNNSGKPSNYIVTVVFESVDGSEQLGSGLVSVNNLAPGQISKQDTASLDKAPKAGGYKCRVGDVTRYAS